MYIIKQVINYSKGASNVLIDLPVKQVLKIDAVFEALENTLNLLRKDETTKDYVFSGCQVQGIENIGKDGQMMIRVKLVTDPSRRWLVARQFRYLLIKTFEKEKIKLG